MNQREKVAQTQEGDDTSLYGKRKKIQIKSVRGRFDNWRIGLVVLTQALFYGLLWLQWNDRQAFLLHLTERKFYIFGMIFWPQDVIYLSAMLIIGAYMLFLVTAVAGRLFCGYACPQTVYTEIFMWIERWVEGDRAARMKLDAASMSGRKLLLRGTKYLLWTLVGLWTGFTFVGYFSPVRELASSVVNFTLGPWETFWIFFYGGFTVLMAGFMREQVCKYMCPYARFQSVMFDPDTLIITYDPERGEPRGARKKGADAGKGDCVDCGICVQVCPTGIDIRDGLQYECIGCAACIDGCDVVMDKLGKPRGLIRYSTENAMARHLSRKEILGHVVRPRILLYTVILILVSIIASWFLVHRIPLKVDVLRDRASLAREVEGGDIENVFTLRVMNTAEQPRRFKLEVDGVESVKLADAGEVAVPPASTKSLPISVRLNPDAGVKGANIIWFSITAVDDPTVKLREKASFMRP